MSQKWVIALTTALAIGAFAVAGASAQTESESTDEPAPPPVDFAQVFADVEAAAPADVETADALRELLYRAGLKMINAVSYDEWARAQEAARFAVQPVD
jgi:ABC-type oligopeptide transport system substrate-binding subunit